MDGKIPQFLVASFNIKLGVEVKPVYFSAIRVSLGRLAFCSCCPRATQKCKTIPPNWMAICGGQQWNWCSHSLLLLPFTSVMLIPKANGGSLRGSQIAIKSFSCYSPLPFSAETTNVLVSVASSSDGYICVWVKVVLSLWIALCMWSNVFRSWDSGLYMFWQVVLSAYITLCQAFIFFLHLYCCWSELVKLLKQRNKTVSRSPQTDPPEL